MTKMIHFFSGSSVIKAIVLWLSLTSAIAQNHGKLELIIDQVQHNPGEAMTQTSFMDPDKLADFGYDGQVLTDYVFVQTLITWDDFDNRIFPKGSEGRAWVEEKAAAFDQRMKAAHDAGIKFLCQPDVFAFPKTLIELYKDEITDEHGQISFKKEKTWEIYRYMIDAVFERFRELDGLVIRTGETYLTNIPFHSGNGPFHGLKGDERNQIQTRFIKMMREEIAEKRDKILVYRTWGYMHTSPEHYLAVTNQVAPHKNLYFSIKHTNGDFHRAYPFNKTLGIGKHKQIVEVQCQREYEGKGAHPNYPAKGAIDGFKEFAHLASPQSLRDLLDNPLFSGIWTWSRGGGWRGPYITNELWSDLNVYVMSQWAQDPTRSEKDVFMDYAKKIGVKKRHREKFHQLSVLSLDGVVKGRISVKYPDIINTWWIRDEFFGGVNVPDSREEDPNEKVATRLTKGFNKVVEKGVVEEILEEKQEAVAIWRKIEKLSRKIRIADKDTKDYLEVSSTYGRIKYEIIANGWGIMLKGVQGDRTGVYDKEAIAKYGKRYDELWEEFDELKANNPQCATLYKPFGFVYKGPKYHGEGGMKKAVDHYRKKRYALN